MADEQAWIEVGARIAATRQARGLSQEDLAEQVGLDRTAITKIEIGRRRVNSLELVRLADALDRPLQSFVSAPPAAVVSRRAAIAGGRDDTASDFAIEDIARDLQVLVEVRALTPNPAKGSLRAIVPGETGWGPEEAATAARTLLGADDRSPVRNLASKAERAGLYAYSLALGDASSDGSYAEIDGVGLAVINGDIGAGRRRATLAHELGHHLFGDAYSADWGTDTSTAEQALDAFAGFLLLPRAGLSDRWQELRKQHPARQSAIIASAEYRVSWSSALRGLRHYDLITGEERAGLESRSPTRADYLECGVRVTRELEPPYVPTGVAAAAIRAYRSHWISAERATAMLRGQVCIDELPARDEIPLESLRGELR
jgi:Zn-dependent peptidase ImmA (M78 family)/DNA-binding XRE family transcriptional regulator